MKDFDNTGPAGDKQDLLGKAMPADDGSRTVGSSPLEPPAARAAENDFALVHSSGAYAPPDGSVAAVVDPKVAAEKHKRLLRAKDDLFRQEQAALSLPIERMEKYRFSLNQHKYVAVDMRNEEQGSVMKLSRRLKCSIVRSSVQDQTDFYIFKSKHVIFEVNTRSKEKN